MLQIVGAALEVVEASGIGLILIITDAGTKEGTKSPQPSSIEVIIMVYDPTARTPRFIFVLSAYGLTSVWGVPFLV